MFYMPVLQFFETLAKDIIGIESIKDQTLGSFFEKYRKESKLPPAALDYIIEQYKKRGKEPLAGHGHVDPPTITREEAVVLAEFTRFVVRTERSLAVPVMDKQNLVKKVIKKKSK